MPDCDEINKWCCQGFAEAAAKNLIACDNILLEFRRLREEILAQSTHLPRQALGEPHASEAVSDGEHWSKGNGNLETISFHATQHLGTEQGAPGLGGIDLGRQDRQRGDNSELMELRQSFEELQTILRTFESRLQLLEKGTSDTNASSLPCPKSEWKAPNVEGKGQVQTCPDSASESLLSSRGPCKSSGDEEASIAVSVTSHHPSPHSGEPGEAGAILNRPLRIARTIVIVTVVFLLAVAMLSLLENAFR